MKTGIEIGIFGIVVFAVLIMFVVINYIHLTKFNECREIDFESEVCERYKNY